MARGYDDTQDGGYGYEDPYPVDEWGRLPSDPWYGIPPGTGGQVPYAPGQGPEPTSGIEEPTGTEVPTPSPPDTPGGGGGGTTIRPFGGTFTPPSLLPYPDLPAIPTPPLPQLPTRPTPPPFQFDPYTPASQWSYQDFTPPSVNDVFADPSYQFRKQQGEQSLQNWAAARGTLNDSGTANALMDYGQNAASQEYSNIWNRGLNTYMVNRGNSLDAFNTNERARAEAYDRNRGLAVDTYNTNYQTQYEDPYRAEYTAAIDTWIPNMEGWRANVDMSRLGYTTTADRTFQQNTQNYDNAWRVFLQDYDRWKDERDTGILLAGQ